MTTQRQEIFDGSEDGIFLPGHFGVDVVSDRLVFFDSDDVQMMNFTRDNGDAGALYSFKPGDDYGYLGINGSAAANELALYAINQSHTAGSSAGFFAQHHSASGGFAYLDLNRYTTLDAFSVGWRTAIVQADGDALMFSTIAAPATEVSRFRLDRAGAFSIKSISAPEAVASFVTFYVDAADNHFKRKDANGTVVDLQLPSGAGLTIGGTITGGADNRVLFESAANVVAESANFTYDNIGDILRVGTAGNPVAMLQGGQVTVNDGGAAESIVGAGTLSCTGDLAIGNTVVSESPGAATRTVAIMVGGVSLKLLAVVG